MKKSKKRMPLFVSARMIVTVGKKILMGFEPPHKYGLGGNHWETPGGKVEYMENVIICLKREAKEEIGTDIRFKDKLPFFFEHNPKKVSKKDYNGMIIYFICEILGKPSLKKAKEKEFNEIKFLDKKEFFRHTREGKIMKFDRVFIPMIMKNLKLW